MEMSSHGQSALPGPFRPLAVAVNDLPSPVTPHHSPHPSHGSSNFRTPFQTLTLHEYRKQQRSPSPTSACGGKTLRRKPKASGLNSLERLPPRTFTPAPPANRSNAASGLARPSTTPPETQASIPFARDLSSIFNDYAALGRDSSHLSGEGAPSFPSFLASTDPHSSFKTGSSFTFSYLDRRSSSAPTHDDIESVYRAYGSPRSHSSVAFRPTRKLPRPEGIRTISSSTSSIKSTKHLPSNSYSKTRHDSVTDPSFSLSKFPQPPQSQPPPPSLKAEEGAPPVTLATTITPPATPTVVHYRGASFDLLNPHNSLQLEAIVTPERDADWNDYFFHAENLADMADDDAESVSSGSRLNRKVFDDLQMAHKAITRKERFVLPKVPGSDESLEPPPSFSDNGLRITSKYKQRWNAKSEKESPLKKAFNSILPYFEGLKEEHPGFPHSTPHLGQPEEGSIPLPRYPSSYYSREEQPQDDDWPLSKPPQEDFDSWKPEVNENRPEGQTAFAPRILTFSEPTFEKAATDASEKRHGFNPAENEMLNMPEEKGVAQSLSSSPSIEVARRFRVPVEPAIGSSTYVSSYEGTHELLELSPKVKETNPWRLLKNKSAGKPLQSPFFSPEDSNAGLEAPPRKSDSSDWKTVDETDERSRNFSIPLDNPPLPTVDGGESRADLRSVAYTHKTEGSSHYESTDSLIKLSPVDDIKAGLAKANKRTSGSSIADISSDEDEDPHTPRDQIFGSPTSSAYAQALQASRITPPRPDAATSPRELLFTEPLPPQRRSPHTQPAPGTTSPGPVRAPQDTRYLPYVPGGISPDPYGHDMSFIELEELHDNGPGPSLVDQTFYDHQPDTPPRGGHRPRYSSSLGKSPSTLPPTPPVPGERRISRPPAVLLRYPVTQQRYTLDPERSSHSTYFGRLSQKAPEQALPRRDSVAAPPPGPPRLFSKYHRQQIFATRANLDGGRYPETPDQQLEAVLRLRRTQLDHPAERQAVRLTAIFCLLAAPIPPVFALCLATGSVQTFLSWCSDGQVTRVPPKGRRILLWTGVADVAIMVILGIVLGVVFGTRG